MGKEKKKNSLQKIANNRSVRAVFQFKSVRELLLLIIDFYKAGKRTKHLFVPENRILLYIVYYLSRWIIFLKLVCIKGWNNMSPGCHKEILSPLFIFFFLAFLWCQQKWPINLDDLWETKMWFDIKETFVILKPFLLYCSRFTFTLITYFINCKQQTGDMWNRSEVIY